MYKTLALLVTTVFIASGCSTYKPIERHAGPALYDQQAKLAIAITVAQPNVWEMDAERGGGANIGLLQAAVILARTASLTTHAKTLPTDDLMSILPEVERTFQGKGVGTVRLPAETVEKTRLSRFDAVDGRFARDDFRPLRNQLSADRLLWIKIQQVGFNYPFSGFSAMGDPMAFVGGEAFVVDLKTNEFHWYKKIRTLRGVGAAWDQAPKYPELTSKYYEALEEVRDALLNDLKR